MVTAGIHVAGALGSYVPFSVETRASSAPGDALSQGEDELIRSIGRSTR